MSDKCCVITSLFIFGVFLLWLGFKDLNFKDIKFCIGPLCPKECSSSVVDVKLKEEIANYSATVDKIIDAVNSKQMYKGKIWNELSSFVDRFSFRFSGTENLENSIDYMLQLLNYYNLDNIHGESVSIPRWVR